jgi:diacylglycerol kinase
VRHVPARATFLASFRYAWCGLVYVVRSQRNMRVHLGAAFLVLLLAAVLRLPPLAWAVLLLCITIVAVLEMLNTVVEATVDLATDRYHPLAKIAKDTAAGAVLVASIGAALVGLVLLGPPLWHTLFH